MGTRNPRPVYIDPRLFDPNMNSVPAANDNQIRQETMITIGTVIIVLLMLLVGAKFSFRVLKILR